MGIIGDCATNTVYYCKENFGEPISDQCDLYTDNNGNVELCVEDARGDICEDMNGFEI